MGANAEAQALANWSSSKRGRRQGRSVGFPRFRSRGTNDSVGYTAAKLRSCGTKVHLPRIGEVDLKENFTCPVGARITGVIVRPKAGRWFVTFKIREDDWVEPKKKTGSNVVAADAGMGDRFATLSDGTVVKNPRFFRTNQTKLGRCSKSLRRKKKGSNNRQKALDRVAKVHYKSACQRQDFIHKFTTNLVKSHDEVVLEDLNLHGMKSEPLLGKSVSDVAWAEARRQIEYKCEWYGTRLTIVDRWFPSSKTCSTCGQVNQQLTLEERSWTCSNCDSIHDRDLNAAQNLLSWSSPTGSSPVSACGDDVGSGICQTIICEAGRSVTHAHKS